MSKSNIRVLVVDDEDLFRRMIVDILKREDYAPDEAASGDEAIRKIQENGYDVVLTDVKMPGASGMEVLEAAKREDPDIQVIVISAYRDADNILKAMRLGATDFLQKPIEVPAIIPNIIESASEKRRLRVENKQLLKHLASRTKELEEALDTIKQQQNELVHAERLKVLGTMSAGMAHEINNPLAFISTNIQTLEKYMQKSERIFNGEAGADELNDYKKNVSGILQGIRNGVSRVSQIAMALKTFARRDGGESQEASINDCVNNATSILAPRLKNIILHKDLKSGVGNIYANEQNLVHTIMNFIQNSCDAVEEAENPTVEVKTQLSDKYKILTISDNGSGISQAEKDKIFEPFFTTKPTGKGTGLGLSIALGVIEKSGGIIDIDSEPGRGTTVTVRWKIEEQ